VSECIIHDWALVRKTNTALAATNSKPLPTSAESRTVAGSDEQRLFAAQRHADANGRHEGPYQCRLSGDMAFTGGKPP